MSPAAGLAHELVAGTTPPPGVLCEVQCTASAIGKTVCHEKGQDV